MRASVVADDKEYLSSSFSVFFPQRSLWKTLKQEKFPPRGRRNTREICGKQTRCEAKQNVLRKNTYAAASS